MIILDGSVDGLEWFKAKNWKSMTYDYKDAASYQVLTLLLYVLGLGTGPPGMHRVLRGSFQPSRPPPGGRGREVASLVSRGCPPSRVGSHLGPRIGEHFFKILCTGKQ